MSEARYLITESQLGELISIIDNAKVCDKADLVITKQINLEVSGSKAGPIGAIDYSQDCSWVNRGDYYQCWQCGGIDSLPLSKLCMVTR